MQSPLLVCSPPADRQVVQGFDMFISWGLEVELSGKALA
jgi:hypothetical protein